LPKTEKPGLAKKSQHRKEGKVQEGKSEQQKRIGTKNGRKKKEGTNTGGRRKGERGPKGRGSLHSRQRGTKGEGKKNGTVPNQC